MKLASSSKLDDVRKNLILRFDLGSGIGDRILCAKNQRIAFVEVQVRFLRNILAVGRLGLTVITVLLLLLVRYVEDFLRGNKQEGRHSFIFVDARFVRLQRVDLTGMLCSTISSLMEFSWEWNNNSCSSVF